MVDNIHKFDEWATLLGAGPVADAVLENALQKAPRLICADGGANGLAGREPDLIIGDLDSLHGCEMWRERLGDRLIHIREQNSTDLEKCLRRVEAPGFIGVGFLGARQDHTLAAFHAIIADPRPTVLISEDDIVFALRGEITLQPRPGARLSILPQRRVTVSAPSGLEWPLQRLALDAGSKIGSSNRATGDPIRLSSDGPGALVFMDPDELGATLRALSATRE